MLTVKETATLLKGFDNVLILTHVRPDGDTVGCAAALCAALRTLGKTAYLLPIPGLTDTTAPFFRPYEAPEGFVPEKVVSTDIATVNLLPENAKEYAGSIDLAMDHHVSFEHFAKENIVRSEAGACGELLYDILNELGCINAETALADPDSVFHHYRKLIELRKTYDVFRDGSFTLLWPEDTRIFAYTRDTETEHLLVVCNFTGETLCPDAPEKFRDSTVLLSNYPLDAPELRPYEAVMLYYHDQERK